MTSLTRAVKGLRCGCSAAMVLLLAACSGNGDGKATSESTNTVTGLSLNGAVSEPATVTLEALPDADGAADAQYRFDVALDGTSLPADAGNRKNGPDLTVTLAATDAAGHVADVQVVIGPPH